MRKVILIMGFFIATPVLLLLTLIFTLYVQYEQSQHGRPLFSHGQQPVAFAALPTSQNVLSEEIIQQDARVEKIKQFLARYNSPLEPLSDYIVDVADTYGLDYRLIPAIAMQESNLCSKIPKDSYNCWGFGIYGGKVTKFDNYKDAVETVTRTLATKYKPLGLVTPDEIMSSWTPSSNGSWAYSVNHFMKEL